ncbi:hypothetical protein ACIQNU_16245 [Streptomyces sp. NPDC091292]|uniref:hypothetical protein n=1 Tax=Streptomyces sp. NPDC091292 TaxID=3365991 RepID=UPI00380E48B2
MGNDFERARPGHGRRARAARAALAASVGAALLTVVTACGGGGGGTDKSGQGESGGGGGDGIASITSPAARDGSAPRASADPDAGRPRIRLDSTQEEINRLYEAWTACLKENGAGDKNKTSPDSPGVKACAKKQPLDPPELDPARNPEYADDVRTMVTCMNEHGVKSVVMEEGWGLEDGASMNAPGYHETLTTCQVKAFGGDE